MPAILGFAGGACSHLLMSNSPASASDKSEQEPIVHKKLRTNHLEILAWNGEVVGTMEGQRDGISVRFSNSESALKDPETGERNENRGHYIGFQTGEWGPLFSVNKGSVNGEGPASYASTQVMPGNLHLSGSYAKNTADIDEIANADISWYGAQWEDKHGPTILWFDAGYGDGEKVAKLTLSSEGHKDRFVLKVPRDKEKPAEMSFLDKDGKVIETLPKAK